MNNRTTTTRTTTTRAFTRAEYTQRKWTTLTDAQRQRLLNNGAEFARWQYLTWSNYRHWAATVS